MSTRPLSELLDCLVNETLTQEEHGTLQILLKSDKAAREQLRERLDVEAALATWASEIPQSEKGVVAPDLSAEPTSIRSHHLVRMTCLGAAAAAAIGLIILAAQLPLLLEQNDTSQASQVPLRAGPLKTRTEVGRLIQQADCKWSAPPLSNGRFAEGTLELTEGAAELRFDSGTNVVIEAPCKLQIDAADAAHLLAGAVFITVTEVSHGFLLTTADASIINEGTQYAVTHDTESTEVHVFEGAVVWTADNDALDFEDRIISGEARRFRRGRPDRPERITFGERQFVRQIEARLRTAADGTLLAYDGFENLAGKLRRGRSGFGWSGGWEASGRGASGRGASGRDIGKGTTGTDTKRGNRGQLAEIVQAPDDFVFGHSRAGRRTLLLADGTEIRRRLEAQWAPLEMDTLYVSLLVRRASEASEKQASFQLSLEPESNSPRFMRRHSISFGITSNGSVYLNNAGRVAETPGTFPTDTTCLLVFKYRVNNGSSYASLRVFPHQEQAAGKETDLWTLSDVVALPASELSGVRLYCGANATWQIDELKVGTNWDAVIQPGDFDRR